MMMMMYGGWIGIISFILLIYFIVTLTDDRTSKEEQKSARDILNERYANGEISDDEYKRMKKLIK